MNILYCPAEKNACFIVGEKMLHPKGIMWHSTGANNPRLSRYVQPCENHPQREELLQIIGVNDGANDWCRFYSDRGIKRCVHAFVGKLRNGRVGIAQTLPWTMRGWHAGERAGNDQYLSFEICEDNLQNEAYFREAYAAAVYLTAYLCDLFDLNPLADGVIICHAEGYKRGIASNHGDVLHWFQKYGVTMHDVRKDVYNLLNLTEDRIREIIQEELLALNSTPSKSLEKEWEQAKKKKITDGSRPGGFATREQVAAMILRATK